MRVRDVGRGQFVEPAFVNTENAPAAPQPKPARIIFENLRNIIIWQSIAGGKGCETPITPAAQPCVHGTNPERALGVKIERANHFARQPFTFLKAAGASVENPMQTVSVSTNPY